MIKTLLLLTASILVFTTAHASSIILHTKNATVWLPKQTISGNIAAGNSNKLTWHVNKASGNINIEADGSFTFTIILHTKSNLIWVDDELHHNITSDTIHYILGYKPLPEVLPFATIKNNTATLDAKIIHNPYDANLQFIWKAVDCPEQVIIHNKNRQTATVNIPGTDGSYYFSLRVFNGTDTAVYKTYVIRSGQNLHAIDITKEHATWIDTAMIYEITPYVFVHDGKYNDITAKLPELKKLGINTIWLQPVYKSYYGEQGYDVTDYFALQPDLGTAQQLHELVSTAKHLGLRVLFDFVPNHTSVYHDYAQEVIKYRKESHYYNFYQHTDDGAPYSSLYHKDSVGFIHYFWNELINLNYQNREVQCWMIEALKYWMQEYDLDGYRLDAMWALNARDSSFGKQLQTALKSINPDFLLLAEDKGADKKVYEEGYDAAYDWRADTNWISKWSWSTDYNPKTNPTIFDYFNPNKRSLLLDKSLFNNGDTAHIRLRFLENNDVPRFITTNGKQRTKMAAALLFALPGIPMIYNGQEIGFERKLYSDKSIFKADESIESRDTNHLFEWYKMLTDVRSKYEALRSTHMQSIMVQPETMYALDRWANNQHIIVLMNMDESKATAHVNVQSINTKNNGHTFRDLLTKEIFYADSSNTNLLNIPMERYSTRLLFEEGTDCSVTALNGK